MSNQDRTKADHSRRHFLERAGGGALIAVAAASAGELIAKELTLEAGAHVPLDPDKKVRLGVVGGGFGSRFFWNLHPNCIVHAVSDLRADRRDHLSKVYECDRSYESLEKLILDDQLDAVAVFTGVPDHARHVSACMNAGKHVISAVTACITLEEAAQLKKVKERTGLKYMMAETSYYRPEAIAARELYQQGAFGELFYTEAEYFHPLTDAHRGKTHHSYWYYQGKRTWRHGYAPMLYVTHATSFLVGTTRERLTGVSCLGMLSPPGIAGYGKGLNQYDNPFNSQMALYKTDQGHACRTNIIWTGTEDAERAQWFGTKMSLYMPGSGGQPLKMRGAEAPPSQLPDYRLRLPPSMQEVETSHGNSHTHLANEFISALIEDREPAVDLYEALAMTVPGIVANESSQRDGEQLSIPCFDALAD
jgi:predicted dehydrogenase